MTLAEGDVLRVPLAPDVRVEVEFRRPVPAIRQVSVRYDAPAAERLRMSIVPLAGNVVAVEIASDLPPRAGLEVLRGEVAVVDREFGFEGLRLRVEPGDRAGVRMTFTALAGPVGADGSVTASSMVVRPHAANLISVLVRDVRGQVVN